MAYTLINAKPAGRPAAAGASPTALAAGQGALVDSFARRVTYLRLSITDRCDLRCTYCMPERMTFLPRKDVLSFEELEPRDVPANFTPGNLAIYRVGDGAAALANTGNAVFLDEYTPGGTLVQSFTMPTSQIDVHHALLASGTATSEGLVTRSVDGRYLVFAGYDGAHGRRRAC